MAYGNFGGTSVSDSVLAVWITRCQHYNFKKSPQLNFSQADLLVSKDKIIDNVLISMTSQKGVLLQTATFARMDIYYFTYVHMKQKTINYCGKT